MSSAKYLFHTCLCLLITFGFGFLPQFGTITPLGMKILGIFLGLLYGWIYIEILWPSLMGILCLMLMSGLAPMEVLQRSFGDPVVQMAFFIFVFCAVIEYYGLAKFISLWFINRKFAHGKPWLFTFMLLGSISLLGGLTSASPAIIIGWTLLYGVCDACGYKKGENYPTMMVFGIVFAAQMGMSLVPFKQAPLTILGVYQTMSGGMGIDYGKYMLIALVICAFTLAAFILIGKYIFKPDTSRLTHLDIEQLKTENSLKLNHVQKLLLVFILLLIILLIVPPLLPEDLFFTKILRAFGNTGIVILLVSIMAAIKIGGKPLLNFKLMADKGIIWPVVFLLAAVQPLSWMIAQESTGIPQFLAESMKPFFEITTPFTFTITLGLIALLLSQIMNNGVVGVALLPVILSYCQSTQINPDLTLIMLVLTIHLALLTPAASPGAALLHGNDWSNSMAIWRAAPIVILSSWLTLLIIIMLLGALIF